MKNFKINISPGEFIDRLTILEIKAKRLKDKNKLKLINKELTELKKDYDKVNNTHLENLKKSLHSVNNKLWNIENKIRKHESNQDFSNGFIKLARLVYINNDQRSQIKNKINTLFKAEIYDIKEYTGYKVDNKK